jgi:hypothetical protein
LYQETRGSRSSTFPMPLADKVRAQSAIYFIVALGLAIRLIGLGWHSLWFDEALEYWRAAGSLRHAVFGRPGDLDPPLYPVLNHFWFMLGTDQAFIRLPAALFGAGAVYLGYVWARAIFGQAIGILTALLLALAPVQVHYSQELNQYSLVVFLSIATLIAFERLQGSFRPADWALYTSINVLDLFTYHGLAFLLLALNLNLIYRGLRSVISTASWRERCRILITPAVSAFVILSVILLIWKIRPDHLAKVRWSRRFTDTNLWREWDFFSDVIWNHMPAFFTLPFSHGRALWIVRAASLLAIAGAVYLLDRMPAGPRILGIGFAIPLAAVHVASGFGLYPFGHRYLLFLTPIYFTALATGLWLIMRANRWIGIAATAMLCGAFVFFSPHGAWSNPWLSVPRQELGPVVTHLERHLRPDDAVYVYYGAKPAFDYYYRGPRSNVKKGTWFRFAKAEVKAVELLAAARDHPRLWLIMSHIYPGEDRQLVDLLQAASFRRVDRFETVNAAAFVFESP